MITIENGELLIGDASEIVEYEFDSFSKDDLWGNPLNRDCWIFTIPSDDSDVGLFNAYDENIDFVPSEHDKSSEHYKMFWNSELTVLFKSHEQALEYMRSYQGPLVDIIRGFYLLYERDSMNDEAICGYLNTNEIDNQTDEHFYNQLSDFVMSKSVNLETAIITMKSYILDHYRFEIAVQRFKNQT